MEFSWYPSSLNEYNTQRTVACFTIRSANSPSYSPTHRSSVREKERPEESRETERHVTNQEQTKSTVFRESTGSHGSVRGQSEDMSTHKMTVQYNQNGRKETLESASDFSQSSAFTARGRTDWRRSNVPSRSKSMDWHTGQRSPDFDTQTEKYMSSTTGGGGLNKHASISSMDRIGAEGGITMRRMAFKSRTLDRPSSVNSLPLRLKSQSGSGLKFSESSSAIGVQGGKSILERIEKLYGSAGLGKGEGLCVPETLPAGGTFPRRFSTGDNYSVRSCMPSVWTEKDKSTPGSEPSLSPWPNRTRETAPGLQRQGQTWGRFSDGANTWRKGFIETGTKSLDRARSKNTVAAQMRAARASSGMTAAQKSVDFSAGIYKDWDILGDRHEGWFKTEEKEKSIRERDKTELKDIDEEVYAADPQKIIERTAERRTFPEKGSVESSASVRNKISQFEALTQRAQDIKTNQVQIPRRTLSMPIKFPRGYEGVKTAESTKVGDGLQKLEDFKKEVKVTRGGRSFSVDSVGLSLEKRGTKGILFSDEGNEKNTDYLSRHLTVKSLLEGPVADRSQRDQKQWCIDETDFYLVSSPDEVHKRNLTTSDTSSLSPPEVTSPVSDDEKTPTNTPDSFSFVAHSVKPAHDTPSAKSENKHTFVSKTQSPDTSPLSQQPVTSSPGSLPELLSPAGKTTNTRGRKQLLDLEAWMTAVNPGYKGWSYNEEFEDDDESTQRDEDSNYDSDSGESSVTITSSMSHSDRKSFSVSLADLRSFSETEADTDDENDEWQPSSRRSLSICSDISTLSTVSMIPAEELERLLDDVKTLGDDSLQDSNDVMVVVLHKEVGVGLGFSIAGGSDQNKPITVHKVFHSGVAAQEGSIKAGDQVLSINGTALQGIAHWEAHRVLRRAKAREMGVVVLRRDDVPSFFKRERKEKIEQPKQTQPDIGQCVRVQLQKSSTHLGFSLEGGADSSGANPPLTVQKVFIGGPTKVLSGDEILQIDGVNVVGMRRLEVWTLIRTLPPGPVEVVLRRPLKRLKS